MVTKESGYKTVSEKLLLKKQAILFVAVVFSNNLELLLKKFQNNFI